MKKIFNVFCCDNCGKRSRLCEEKHKEHAGYPYEDGWIYLYNFLFKTQKDKDNSLRDKHLCSIACLEMELYNKIHGVKNARTEN